MSNLKSKLFFNFPDPLPRFDSEEKTASAVKSCSKLNGGGGGRGFKFKQGGKTEAATGSNVNVNRGPLQSSPSPDKSTATTATASSLNESAFDDSDDEVFDFGRSRQAGNVDSSRSANNAAAVAVDVPSKPSFEFADPPLKLDEALFDDEFSFHNGQFDPRWNIFRQPTRHHQHLSISQQHPSQVNSNHRLLSKQQPQKAQVAIDDVSYHDEPHRFDTNPLTDVNWRYSTNHCCSPSLHQYVVEEVDKESDEDGEIVNVEQRLWPPHPIREKHGASHLDPPGTFIDDISTSGGLDTGSRLNHRRYPSVAGNSKRLSQLSLVGQLPPRGPLESLRKGRRQRQTAQSRGQPPNLHLYEPPRLSDPWDIEYVVTPDTLLACDASSLGNLTGEYGPLPQNGENDEDTATFTMNTVDLVAEVKRVWRHVQKYEEKRDRKKSLMAQYQAGDNDAESEAQDMSKREMMGPYQELNPQEVSFDDNQVSDLAGFSQIHSSGAAMKSNAADVPINSGRGRSLLKEHLEDTQDHNFQSNSPEISYWNASIASTEKDVAFVTESLDLFFDQSQAPMNAHNNYMLHPRVPVSHHHKIYETNNGNHSSIPLPRHPKEQRTSESNEYTNSNLAQPYDMAKSRSMGTALSSKTQKASNRTPDNNTMFVQNRQDMLSGRSGSTNKPSISPPQDYIQTHKAQVDLYRRYMKQRGRFS